MDIFGLVSFFITQSLFYRSDNQEEIMTEEYEEVDHEVSFRRLSNELMPPPQSAVVPGSVQNRPTIGIRGIRYLKNQNFFIHPHYRVFHHKVQQVILQF